MRELPGSTRASLPGDCPNEGTAAMQSMRRCALSVAGICLAFLFAIAGHREAAAQQQVPALAQALLQFEENVTWDAVDPNWADARDAWVAAVQATSRPGEVAAQLLALEESMGWDAVEGRWRQRRPRWVSEMQSARSDGAVAQGLLELEHATLWSAVTPEWRQLRDGWVAGLESIR